MSATEWELYTCDYRFINSSINHGMMGKGDMILYGGNWMCGKVLTCLTDWWTNMPCHPLSLCNSGRFRDFWTCKCSSTAVAQCP